MELDSKIFEECFKEAEKDLLDRIEQTQIIYDNNTPIGFYILEEGYIYSIGIIPEYRGKGIIGSILKDILLENMSLHVYVENEPAIALYRKYDFDILYRERDFYGPGLDAFYMER